MCRKNIIFVLFTLVFVAALGRISAGRDQVPGSESDRGTLRTPDLVATPHTGKDAQKSEDQILKHVPNRSLADDTNRDGVVSRNEWKGRPADFNRLDTNHDEVLSPRELDAYIQVGLDRFAEIDLNRDGFIARNEWKDPMPFFDKLDLNKDSKLSRSEYYGGGLPIGNAEPENR